MPTDPKKFFDARHYYALAKEIRSVKANLGDRDQILYSLEQKLCQRFRADNPEFICQEWHRRCQLEADPRE